MKRLTAAAALLALLPIQSFAEQPAPDPPAFVDPMIGTGPEGHTFPGATAPFGMVRSEEHTSELQSLMRSSYAVFCLKKLARTTAVVRRSGQHTSPLQSLILSLSPVILSTTT